MVSKELGSEVSKDPSKDLGSEVSKDPSKELGSEVSKDPSKELGSEVSKELGSEYNGTFNGLLHFRLFIDIPLISRYPTHFPISHIYTLLKGVKETSAGTMRRTMVRPCGGITEYSK